MQEKTDLTLGVSVPTGRVARLASFGAMATGILGAVVAGGARQLATGKRPDLQNLLLTPANAMRLSQSLSQMRGAALKMGQMLSMDTGVVLGPEVTAILASLRDDAAPMPPKQLQTTLNAEWGAGWYGRFHRFDLRPFAAASIGQVHRAMTPDGRDLAIKVQYPGVRASIDSDIANMASLMRLPGLLPQSIDIRPLLEEAKRQLHAEADYQAEAAHLVRFGGMLADDPRFVVPEYYSDLSTPQVLAMRYVNSQPLDSLHDAPQELRDQVAARLIELTLRELFEFGAMQTDPNLANYRFIAQTGQIVLLDFGAVQPIAPETTADFRALLNAALGDDASAIRTAMLKIGYFTPTTPQADLIQKMFCTAMEPLRAKIPFDFAASDLLDQLRRMGLAIGQDRELLHVPPAATLFLHRKIGGMYLMASKLRARIALGPMIETYR
jgi:predicted unusual protein kinase regulating ubiquinone biosynthesis (AarF/ABC1/UbiB family)